MAHAWLEIKKAEITADYADDIWRSLELHAFPRLGNVPLEDLSAQRVIRALKPLEAKGSLEAVKRVCMRLNQIMTFAVNTGLIKHNCLAGIKAGFLRPEKKHLPSISPNELPKLLRDIYMASIRTTTRELMLWQLQTMVRPSEAAGTQWCEIDFDRGLWTIPAERMKRKQIHIVPLCPKALELLTRMKAISGESTHVFPSDRKGSSDHINSQSGNVALKRMGYGGTRVPIHRLYSSQ
ncbi:MAG: tyrosine-type recombinase/integrase [Cellvibrionales bacterium]|nr:tyrosine-type recombinase/integrase [Cellvibrionales bacterium]